MQKSDRVRLKHMLDAAQEAVSLARGKDRAALTKERTLALALVKLIEIVGEAASQTSPEFRAGLPDIPWAAIVGMRNRLIHAYFDINLDVLWKTVDEDLPALIVDLERASSHLQ